jgi:hypothetical protein
MIIGKPEQLYCSNQEFVLSLGEFLNCLLRLHPSLAMKTMMIPKQRKIKGEKKTAS